MQSKKRGCVCVGVCMCVASPRGCERITSHECHEQMMTNPLTEYTRAHEHRHTHTYTHTHIHA